MKKKEFSFSEKTKYAEKMELQRTEEAQFDLKYSRRYNPTQRQYKALVNYFHHYICRGHGNLWSPEIRSNLVRNLWMIGKENDALEYLNYLEENDPEKIINV